MNALEFKIQVWKHQRILMPEQVQRLKDKLVSTDCKKGILGTWSVCRSKAQFTGLSDTLQLIDGQHRWQALQEIQKNYKNLKMPPIILHVYEVEDDEEIEKIFFNLNQNTKVDVVNFDKDARNLYRIAFQNFRKTLRPHAGRGRAPRESLKDDHYVDYLIELCYNEKVKDVTYQEVEKQIFFVNKKLQTLFTDKKHLNTMDQYFAENFKHDNFKTKEELIHGVFKDMYQFNWVQLFVSCWSRKDYQEHLRNAAQYDNWIGMFAVPANHGRMDRKKFAVVFWQEGTDLITL
jgi:hypothetical protein